MPRLAALLAVAFTLLAGCAASPEPATPEAGPAAASPAGETIALTQSGCHSFYSGHRVEKAFATARLPAGLDPYDNAGGALLMLKAWTCPEASEEGHAGSALVYYIAVRPQAPYDGEHLAFAWYPLELIAHEAALVESFHAWGFDLARQGTVTIDWNTDDPWLVRVNGATASPLWAEITIPQFASEEGAFTVRYFAAKDGVVTSAVDIVVHPGSRGGGGPTLWRLQGDHAPGPAPLLGSSSYQGWDKGELSYTWTPVTFG